MVLKSNLSFQFIPELIGNAFSIVPFSLTASIKRLFLLLVRDTVLSSPEFSWAVDAVLAYLDWIIWTCHLSSTPLL